MLIKIDDLSVEIIRKRIKNMYLRVYPPHGDIKISAPLKMPLDKIQHYVHSKQQWIRTTQTRYTSHSKPKPLTMQTGEFHYFLGKPYQLILHTTTQSKTKIILETIIENNIAGYLHLFIPSDSTEEQKKSILTAWYKQQMQQRLSALIKKWEAIIGVQVSECKIRQMKTRWGSCNINAHRIWLNLNLIQKSLPCLESVLVHEMTHLHEPSHNKRFYTLMDTFMPQWRQYKYELKS